jgi:hypothetical protein
MKNNMNVTLSLTTKLEDIPRELSHILKHVEQELKFASLNTSNLSKTVNAAHDNKEAILTHGKEAMDSLHDIRLVMAKIDTRMDDCMSILAGYMHYVENPPEEQEGTQEENNEEG